VLSYFSSFKDFSLFCFLAEIFSIYYLAVKFLIDLLGFYMSFEYDGLLPIIIF